MASLDNRFTGIGSIQEIPAEQRIYGRTKDILRLVQGRINMMRVLSDKMGSQSAVTDMEFKYKSDYPQQALIPIGATSTHSTGTENDIMWIATAYAPFIQVGTKLFVDRVYYNGTTFAAGTGDDYTPASTTNSQRECIKVLEVLNESGGNRGFRVQRGYKPAQGSTYGGGGTPTQLTTAMKLLLSIKPQAVGDNTGNIYGDTPHEESNYCEITLEKMGVARTAERINIYQDKTILQRNSERQLDVFWKKQELNANFGRKALSYSSTDGAPIYEAGGLDEYIRTAQSAIGYNPFGTSDADQNANVVNFGAAYGPLSFTAINNFGRNKFYWGSQTKWWICDDIQFTKISNSLDPRIRIQYNQPLSLKLGFKVNDLEISGGGTFHLAQSDLWSIYGLRNYGTILDDSYFKPVNLQGEDFTIMVDVEKGMNPLKRIDYLYMNRGYWRNCPMAHFIVYNL